MSNSPTPDPWKKNMTPATSYSARVAMTTPATPQPAEAMSKSTISQPEVESNGQHVIIEMGCRVIPLSAQDAYDLHQAISSILPQLVQPFKPWPREVKP